MSYHPPPPRPRSRSRSPEYRQRRYSPSRAVSPLPARRYDDYAPPPRRYEEEISARPMSMRRRDSYSVSPPPARRYDDHGPPRDRDRYDYSRRSPPRFRSRSHSRSRSPLPPRARSPPQRRSPPHRSRPGAEDFYDAPPPSSEREDRFQPRETWRPEVGRGREPGAAIGGMAADREEARPVNIPRGPSIQEGQWERGRDVGELESTYGDFTQNDTTIRGKGPSPPSRDVIFLGLDPDLSESDFLGYLRQEHRALIDSVKIARDKRSGSSKFFGFAQFASLEGAEAFISLNYPHILMPALYEHSDPRKVKIDFAAAQPGPGGPPQPVPYHDSSAQPLLPPRHDGAKDIGPFGGGNRVLLLQGLDWGTGGEEIIRRLSYEIARMLGKTGREREAELSICRVALIRDKSGFKKNWGFAFVELITAELASALIPFLGTPVHQPKGFLITGVPIAVFPANPSAFVPTAAGPLGGQYLLRSSRNGGIGSATIDQPDGAWCAYWSEHAGAVQVIPRSRSPPPEDGSSPEITTDLRIFLGNLAGPPPAPANAPTGPAQTLTTAPVPSGSISISTAGIQPIKIGLAKKAKIESDGLIPLEAKNVLGDDEDMDVVGKDTVLLSRTKGAHIVPPTSSSRKIAKNISKWNNKQTELAAPAAPKGNGPPGGLSSANAVIGVSRTNTQPIASTSQAGRSTSQQSASPTAAVDGFDYTDISTLAATGKVACLLCQRQFKTQDVLKKHVAQSDLHKTNLLDPAVCEAGQRRKNAATASASAAPGGEDPAASEGDDIPKYQDRAAMRREAFNQPDKPSYQEIVAMSTKPQFGQGQKRKFVEGPKPPPPPPEAGPAPGVDDSNVGNQLLAKMGWTAGTGLGKGNEGRVDPVAVQQFENRAGLGASKGREAGKWDGQAGFQQRALDMAKERYNNGS